MWTFRRSLPRLAALGLLILSAVPSFAQAPPAVPALPDTERRTSYSLSGTTCACSVGFALYGTSTDVDEWIQVYIAGVRYLSTDPAHGWSLSSATGSLATIPRPITDAVLTFGLAQTGTVQIVGAERPRRAAQFAENRGVAARDLNQALTDIVAQNRETWDEMARSLLTPPGNVMGPLPAAPACAGGYLNFGPSGLAPICTNLLGLGMLGTPLSATVGDLAIWNNTTGTLLADSHLYYNPAGGVTLNVDHATGVDQVGCGFGSGTAACKTIYYAFLSFQTNVKVGPGGVAIIQSDCGFTETPPGAFLGPTATGGAGGGVVFLLGNESSPSSCSWTSGGIIVDDGAVFSLRGFTAVTASPGQTWLSVSKLGLVVSANMIWGAAVSGAPIVVGDGGVFVFEDGGSQQVGISACAPNCFNYFIINNGGSVEFSGITVSVPNALTFNAWYAASGAGANATWSSNTFTGAGSGGGSTGAQFNVSNGANLQLSATTLPGLAADNTVSSMSCANALCVPGSKSNTAGLPTCNSQNYGATAVVNDSTVLFWGAQVSGGGGGVVQVFCNGTAWYVNGSAQTTAALAYLGVGAGLVSSGGNLNLTVGQLPGTTTNDSASAGKVGEYVTSSIAYNGSTVSLTTATPTNIVSITLTAGDWDVRGFIGFTGGGTTSVTFSVGSISATSATIDLSSADRSGILNFNGAPLFNTAFGIINFSAGYSRFSLSTTTTIYLVARADFTVSTCSGYGAIEARRVR